MKDFLVDLGQGFLSVHYDSISYSNHIQKIKQILKNKFLLEEVISRYTR
jgi:hypothetical protein